MSRNNTGRRVNKLNDRDDAGYPRILTVFLFVILAAYLAVFFVKQAPNITDHYIINSDERIWVAPLFAAQGVENPNHDWLALQLRNHYIPWGYLLIAGACLKLVSPYLFVKLCTILIYAAILLLVFLIGRELGGNTVAVLATLIAAHANMCFDFICWGIPRSFSLPLVLLLVWGLIVKRRAVVAAALVLGALIYPIVAPTLLMIWGLDISYRFFKSENRPSFLRAEIIGLIGVSICMALLISRAVYVQDRAGKIYSPEQARQMEEFREKGRFYYFPLLPLRQELERGLGMMLVAPGKRDEPLGPLGTLAWEFILFGLVIIGIAAGRRAPPAWMFCWLAGGLTVLLISRAIPPTLIEPGRHSFFSLALVPILLLPWALHQIAGRLGASARSMLIISFLCSLFLLGGTGLVYDLGRGVNENDKKPLFEFIDTLPTDALLAGPPDLLDSVRYFTGRAQYVGYEATMPYCRDFYSELKRRALAVGRAYYAADAADVVSFADREGVDYMILDNRLYRGDFLAGKVPFFFEPIDSEIRLSVNRNGPFALGVAPKQSVIYLDRQYAVIDMELFARLTD